MGPTRYDVLLFDMDNTLLKSRIDFAAIKRGVFRLAVETGMVTPDFPVHEHTIATFLEHVRGQRSCTPELERAMWDVVVEGERIGMEGAELEPGVPELLDALHGAFRLVVLTNNAWQAATEALSRTGIASFFDHIAGREQMRALKPSPSGVAHLRSLYADVPADRWVSIGDSWIDGKAAADGGIAFIAYRANREELVRRGVAPVGWIDSMGELEPHLYD